MLKSKFSKKAFSLAIALILVMSFSLSAYATPITITETRTESVTDYCTCYSTSGLSESDVLSQASTTRYYSSGGFSGTLDYQYYYIISSRYVYGNICEYYVGVVYSGTVTRVTVYEDPKTQTAYNSITMYSTYDQLDSAMNMYQGSTMYYNDAHYSGTLNYQGYSVSGSTYVYSSIYLFNIDLIYSGTVNFHY